jgi:hypothetical protein
MTNKFTGAKCLTHNREAIYCNDCLDREVDVLKGVLADRSTRLKNASATCIDHMETIKNLTAENAELRKKVEEAKRQICPTCIARRGIDKCRPDEAFHVTHYDAEEMHMDPLPDKLCECGRRSDNLPDWACGMCGDTGYVCGDEFEDMPTPCDCVKGEVKEEQYTSIVVDGEVER